MSSDRITKLISSLESLSTLSNKDNDDKVIIELSIEAKNYLLSHPWCSSIEEEWLGLSWGYILCVFLFRIKSNYPDLDEYLWMVVGDIPPAYIDLGSAASAEEAIKCYIDIMNDWVFAVENNKPVEDYYPVEVPSTSEYASMLKSRLNLIENELSGSL